MISPCTPGQDYELIPSTIYPTLARTFGVNYVFPRKVVYDPQRMENTVEATGWTCVYLLVDKKGEKEEGRLVFSKFEILRNVVDR